MQIESTLEQNNTGRMAVWVVATSVALWVTASSPGLAQPQEPDLAASQAELQNSLDELDKLLEALDHNTDLTGDAIKPGTSKKENGNKTTFDPDDRSSLAYQITPELSVGGKVNLELKLKSNEDLDDEEPDRLLLLESLLSLAAMYQLTPDIEIFGETRLSDEDSLEDTNGKKKEEKLIEFREGYILVRNLFDGPFGVQIGRQKLKDNREWLIDERLDAVRVFFEEGPWSGELSMSSMLIDPDGNEDKITNYLASLTFEYAKKSTITLFGMSREDRSNRDRDPVYLGVQAAGRLKKRRRYWLDSAVMMGHDRRRDLLGVGLDAGWSQQFKHPLKPSYTLGFAFGSGDDKAKDNKDREFQQTDLQDNTGRYFGRTKFSYYGEVFDPELSNMMIFTVGVGIVPSKNLSLDLVYHYYELVELSDELRDAAVVEDLTGKDKHLGHEIDLILGLKFTDNIRGSFTAGAFLPGSAFKEDRAAYATQFKIQMSF